MIKKLHFFSICLLFMSVNSFAARPQHVLLLKFTGKNGAIIEVPIYSHTLSILRNSSPNTTETVLKKIELLTEVENPLFAQHLLVIHEFSRNMKAWDVMMTVPSELPVIMPVISRYVTHRYQSDILHSLSTNKEFRAEFATTDLLAEKFDYPAFSKSYVAEISKQEVNFSESEQAWQKAWQKADDEDRAWLKALAKQASRANHPTSLGMSIALSHAVLARLDKMIASIDERLVPKKVRTLETALSEEEWLEKSPKVDWLNILGDHEIDEEAWVALYQLQKESRKDMSAFIFTE